MEKSREILLKVCGLKYPENVLEVAKLKPDYMGFIFYPKSPRYVAGILDPALIKGIDASICKVGVFVNEGIEIVIDLAKKYHLDALQLHGDESPEYCALCRKEYLVIKAFPMSSDFNVEVLEKYKNDVDYFLFDTRTEKFGGSGLQFNWDLLRNYRLEVPYFLSGGIDSEDIERAFNAGIPPVFALDINSKVEVSPGLKDTTKVKLIRDLIHKINAGALSGEKR